MSRLNISSDTYARVRRTIEHILRTLSSDNSCINLTENVIIKQITLDIYENIGVEKSTILVNRNMQYIDKLKSNDSLTYKNLIMKVFNAILTSNIESNMGIKFMRPNDTIAMI